MGRNWINWRYWINWCNWRNWRTWCNWRYWRNCRFTFNTSISNCSVITIHSIEDAIDAYIHSRGEMELFNIDGQLYFASVHVDGEIDRNAISILNDQLKMGHSKFTPEDQSCSPKPSGAIVWTSNSPHIDDGRGDGFYHRLSWIQWCSYNMENWVKSFPLHAILIKIDDGCLCIKNGEDFLRFNEIYGDGTHKNCNIYWDRVVEDGYTSIFIMPYLYTFRDHDWFNGWDVSSIAIMSPFNKEGEQIVFTKKLTYYHRCQFLSDYPDLI